MSSSDDDPYEMLLGPVFGGPNSPDAWRTALCIVIIVTVGALAAGAGVGGGGIYVPVFSILLGLTTKAAAPLTKITVLGGSIGSMFFIFWKQHPKALRPLIDYEVSTFMQTGELLGVTIGVIFNVLLADIVIMIFLIVVLAFNGYRTLRKGRIMYHMETAAFASELRAMSPMGMAEVVGGSVDQARRDLKAFLDEKLLGHAHVLLEENGVFSLFDLLELEDDQSTTDEFLTGTICMTAAEVQHLRDALKHLRLEGAVTVAPSCDAGVVEAHSPGSNQRRARFSHDDDDASTSTVRTESTLEPTTPEMTQDAVEMSSCSVDSPEELEKMYADSAVQFPVWAYVVTVGMVLFTTLYAWVKSVYLNPCYSNTIAYYVWVLSPFLVLGGASVGVGYYLNRLHSRRIEVGYAYLSTDVQWDTYKQVRFSLTAVLAGFSAGLLGIGGGMILGPLFVEIGMQPQSSAASCAFMIFWTGLSAVIQYYFQGQFAWQWLVIFGSAGLVSGQVGQRAVYHAIKKSSRPSFIVFVLGAIILLALALMTINSSIDLASDWTTAPEMFAVDTSWTLCSYYENN